MRRGSTWQAAAFVFLGAVLHSVAEEGPGMTMEDLQRDNFVEALDNENFDDVLSENERVLVEFYTPGCSGCEEFEAEYNKASKLLRADDLTTLLAKVDATSSSELVERFGVKKYPSFKYFVNGKFVSDYDGKRDSDGVILFIKNKEKPPVKEMDEKDLEKFLDKIEDNQFALVARIKKKSARAKAYFKAVEEQLREWDVAKISFVAIWLPKDADPKADAKLSMHRPAMRVPNDPDSETVEFTGVWSEDKITWWVKNSTYRTIGWDFSRNKYAPMSMDAMGWTAAVVAVVDDSAAIDQEAGDELLGPLVEEAMRPCAVENPQFRFVIAELDKLEEHENILLGVNAGDEPRIVFLSVEKKKYHLIGDDAMNNTDMIRKFLSDAKGKKIKPFYSSANDPETGEEYEEGVLVVTGNTFETKVLDPQKDVFVFFYSPWCKHCEALKPKWEELAKKVGKEGWVQRNIVIAKFDAVVNECEEEVQHFPKVVLYPAVKASRKFSQKTVFAGTREVGPLIDFINTNARNLQDDDEDEDEDEDEDQRKKKKRRKQSSSGKTEEL